jgi:hypothetical protein
LGSRTRSTRVGWTRDKRKAVARPILPADMAALGMDGWMDGWMDGVDSGLPTYGVLRITTSERGALLLHLLLAAFPSIFCTISHFSNAIDYLISLCVICFTISLPGPPLLPPPQGTYSAISIQISHPPHVTPGAQQSLTQSSPINVLDCIGRQRSSCKVQRDVRQSALCKPHPVTCIA